MSGKTYFYVDLFKQILMRSSIYIDNKMSWPNTGTILGY